MPSYQHVGELRLVSAVLSRQRCPGIIEQLLAEWTGAFVETSARGTLLPDRWYQGLLPVYSPEMEVLNFLVEPSHARPLMARVAELARLHLSGYGAVTSVPCLEAHIGSRCPMFAPSAVVVASPEASSSIKGGMSLLVCIVQRGHAERIARQAMRAGASGPTIYYAEGTGLRDKLGLMRITGSREKEVLQVLVDDIDAEPVFNALAAAGRFTEPGRGFLYQVPVDCGLNSLPGVFAPEAHAASMQQIVRALDELKGSTAWRETPDIGDYRSRRVRALTPITRRPRSCLQDFEMLVCLVGRKDARNLMQAAISAGAPAGSISYARQVSTAAEMTSAGVRLHKERALIKSVLPGERVPTVREAMMARAEELGLDDPAFFVQPVPLAVTYLG